MGFSCVTVQLRKSLHYQSINLFSHLCNNEK